MRLLIKVMRCGVNEGLTYQTAFDSLCFCCCLRCEISRQAWMASVVVFLLPVSLIEFSKKQKNGKKEAIWCSVLKKETLLLFCSYLVAAGLSNENI